MGVLVVPSPDTVRHLMLCAPVPRVHVTPMKDFTKAMLVFPVSQIGFFFFVDGCILHVCREGILEGK